MGMLRRSALLLIMLQLLLFMAVLLITMARGLRSTAAAVFFERPEGWAAVLEDVLLFGATAWVYWRESLTSQEKGVKPVPVSPGVT